MSEQDASQGGTVQARGRTWAVRSGLMATLASLDGKQFSARAVRGPGTQRHGAVAVIPVHGVITPQPSFLSALLGGGDASLSTLRTSLRSAVADPDTRAIVLDIDSPGGMVDGVPEMADEIRQAREHKPIVAVANTLAASAAYWLASQAHEVVASPSAEIGSIGVYQLHEDVSQAMDKAGVKPTLISAGKFKTEGHPYGALGDEAMSAAQQGVDDYYGLFVNDVAAGRSHTVPVTADDVANGFGQGRTLTAKRAVSANLADRVATLPDTIARLSSGRSRVRRSAEDIDLPTHADRPRVGPLLGPLDAPAANAPDLLDALRDLDF